MPLYHDAIRAGLPALRDSRLYRWNPTFANPRWEESTLRVLILRLSPYRDVERSTPHLFLAGEVRAGAPGAFIDMAFLPPEQDRALLGSARVPLIIGTQSHRSLDDFHLLLVSHSCIPEIVNLPFLLLCSDVPLMASERSDRWPAIILGGSSSAASQAIVTEDGDCMADALFFGEGEGAVRRIAELWAGSEGLEKRARLGRVAAGVQGLWLAGDPGMRVERRVAPAEAAGKAPRAPMLPGEEAGTGKLEITRGCPCLCSFCFEGHDRKPFREIPLPALLEAAGELKRRGAETLEISSFNFNTHTGILDLLLSLNRKFLHVNAMSQRVDVLARTPWLLDFETAAGKRSFTLGIEGVSERLRRRLHKSLPTDDILKVLEQLHGKGARELKLFFLLTGNENAEDLEELRGLVKWLKQVRALSSSPPRVVFSFGALVRMPFTPLRYEALLLDEKAWRRLAGRVKSICETHGFEFRLATSWLDYRIIQVLAMGDCTLHRLAEGLARDGCAYDGEFPARASGILEQWLAASPGREAGLLREKTVEHPFPFAFLESPEERASLFLQYGKAKNGVDEGYCRKGKKEGCRDCTWCTRGGAAAAGEVKPRLSRSPDSTREGTRVIARLLSDKARLKPVFRRMRIPPEAAAASSEWRNAWLLAEVLERSHGQTDNILSARENMISRWMGSCPAPWFGEVVVSILAWDTARLADGESAGGTRDGESFHTLSLRAVFPLEHFPDAQDRVLEGIRESLSGFTLKRRGAELEIVVAEKALKKKGLQGGLCRRTGASLELDLTVGHRFEPQCLFARFPRPGSAALCSIEIVALELS